MTATRLAPAPARVTAVQRESADAASLTLATPAGHEVAPGQFAMVYVFGVGEAALSVSATTAAGGQVHTIRAVGPVTDALTQAPVGAAVGWRGPFGVGWPLDRARDRDVVLVAGGIGLAPLRPVVHAVLAQRTAFRRLLVLYGARSPEDRIFRDELVAWEAREDVELATTVDYALPTWRGRVGFVTALLPRIRFDPERTVAMLCGPEVMMRTAANALIDRGVPAGDVYVSLERAMHCGVGTCGHCQLGPELVCRDGPVFPYARVRALLTIREL